MRFTDLHKEAPVSERATDCRPAASTTACVCVIMLLLLPVGGRSLSSLCAPPPPPPHSLTQTPLALLSISRLWCEIRRRRCNLRGHSALLAEAFWTLSPDLPLLHTDRRGTKTSLTKRLQIHIVWVLTRLHQDYLQQDSFTVCSE